MQPWDLTNPVQATLIARETPDPSPNALKNVWLPEREINDVRFRRARSQRVNSAAKFRAYKSESPIGERGFTAQIDQGKFIPISEKLPLDESDQIELYLAQQSGDLNGPAYQTLVEQAYDDIRTISTRIWNRMELARGDVLVDGKFTLAGENGLTMEADFGLVSAQLPTLGTPISDPTVALIDIERGWIAYVQNLSGKPVAKALTSQRVVNYMLVNNQYRQLTMPGLSLANIPNITGLTALNQYRVGLGLPPIEIYEHQISVDGVATRVIPDDRFILGVADIGETQWGITADALNLAKSGAVVVRPTSNDQLGAAGLIAGTWFTPDPVMKWTKVAGAGIPLLADPTGLLTATVL